MKRADDKDIKVAGETMYGVTITELIQKIKLKNMIPEIDTDKVVLSHPDVNRPALQLTGFFDHFDKERVQIIGFVEQEYIKTPFPGEEG